MKALQVIQSAYRCNIEEQDDPAVWIAHAMKGAGAELGVLLRGNAANYSVKNQDASGLQFGDRAQTHPPEIERDITSLLEKGVSVYVVEEDLSERGIEPGDVLPGLELVRRAGLPVLFSRYEQVWHW